MPKNSSRSTSTPREKALLVGVTLEGEKIFLTMEDSLAELALLCETAGLDVVGDLTQKLNRINSQTYIGSGKLDELIALAEDSLADVVVFDNELNPRHQRELEQALGKHVRVLDRTAVILDIFAQHAHTNEGQLQVKLAQCEYYLPRLTGQWTHLARQAGGGGGRAGSVGGVGLRGPGETQLEVDRRAIRREITRLKKEIDKIRMHREASRSQRKRANLPVIALVGYTNAGKSTLLNSITHADVLVADKLFATLDPTTRRVFLSNNETALITDTVGFIQKLPTSLVSAFRATLEEIAEADLLVHVIDISHPNAINQAESVQHTLKEIGADHIPVVTALNKIDLLINPASSLSIDKFPRSVAISARTEEGLDKLVDLIRFSLYEQLTAILVRIPYKQGQLISLVHQYGQIEFINHERTGVCLQARIPGRFAAQFTPWKITTNEIPEKDAENDQID